MKTILALGVLAATAYCPPALAEPPRSSAYRYAQRLLAEVTALGLVLGALAGAVICAL